MDGHVLQELGVGDRLGVGGLDRADGKQDGHDPDGEHAPEPAPALAGRCPGWRRSPSPPRACSGVPRACRCAGGSLLTMLGAPLAGVTAPVPRTRAPCRSGARALVTSADDRHRARRGPPGPPGPPARPPGPVPAGYVPREWVQQPPPPPPPPPSTSENLGPVTRPVRRRSRPATARRRTRASVAVPRYALGPARKPSARAGSGWSTPSSGSSSGRSARSSSGGGGRRRGKTAAQMKAIANAAVPPEWYVVATLLGLWVGFIGAPWLASRTQGTRDFLRDLGVRFRLSTSSGSPSASAARSASR